MLQGTTSIMETKCAVFARMSTASTSEATEYAAALRSRSAAAATSLERGAGHLPAWMRQSLAMCVQRFWISSSTCGSQIEPARVNAPAAKTFAPAGVS